MKKIFFICLMFTSASFAQSTADFHTEGPSIGRRVRNLGMGNIGVAIHGTADSSPFYNPAGMNDLEDSRIQFMALTVDVSKGAIDLIGDVYDLNKDIDDAQTEPQKTQAIDNFTRPRFGKSQHARLAIDFFNYTRKNFALGMIMDERLNIAVRNQGPGQFDLQNLGDVALYVSGSHNLWEKRLQFGVTLRPTMRFTLDEADQTITYQDAIQENASGDPVLKDQFKNIYEERRFGLGVDFGVKSNLAFPGVKALPGYELLKPAVGFTWQDIGGPSFATGPGNEQSLSAGVAVHPDLWILKTTFGADLRGINQDRPFLTKFCLGGEATLPLIAKMNLGVRGGYGQGYLTGGVTLDLRFLRIDGAIYSEESGNHIRTDGDLRWAASIAFNI